MIIDDSFSWNLLWNLFGIQKVSIITGYTVLWNDIIKRDGKMDTIFYSSNHKMIKWIQYEEFVPISSLMTPCNRRDYTNSSPLLSLYNQIIASLSLPSWFDTNDLVHLVYPIYPETSLSRGDENEAGKKKPSTSLFNETISRNLLLDTPPPPHYYISRPNYFKKWNESNFLSLKK